MEYSPMKIKEVQLYALTWMNSASVIWSEKSQI